MQKVFIIFWRRLFYGCKCHLKFYLSYLFFCFLLCSLLLWCWEGLRARGEGDDRGWDGWMASLTRWTWVWVNSGSRWWTGRPGVPWFMGSQRVGHDWATDRIRSCSPYLIFSVELLLLILHSLIKSTMLIILKSVSPAQNLFLNLRSISLTWMFCQHCKSNKPIHYTSYCPQRYTILKIE